MLAASGKTVLISDYFEYYRLAAYLGQHTKDRIAIVMGASSLRDLFEEKYYTALEGGILESFGRLFKNDLRLYIYPLLEKATGKLVTVENLEVPPKLRKLYGHLVDSGLIKQLENVNRDYLHIFSRDALQPHPRRRPDLGDDGAARGRDGHQDPALPRLPAQGARAGRVVKSGAHRRARSHRFARSARVPATW